MIDNNNSSKNEFDFEEDNVKGKVVDQSMIGSKSLPMNKKLFVVIAVVLVFVAIKLFKGKNSNDEQADQPTPATLVQSVAGPSAQKLVPMQSPENKAVTKSLTPAVPDRAQNTNQQLNNKDLSGSKNASEDSSAISNPPATNEDQSTLSSLKALIEKMEKKNNTTAVEVQGSFDDLKSTQLGLKKAIDNQAEVIKEQNAVIDQLRNDLMAKVKEAVNNSADLANKVTKLQDVILKLGAEFTESGDEAQVVKPTTLYIHAIIPGRVWLRDQNNRIFSAVPGDDIQGYGKVLSIDPRAGTVMTSSGQLLRQ